MAVQCLFELVFITGLNPDKDLFKESFEEGGNASSHTNGGVIVPAINPGENTSQVAG